MLDRELVLSARKPTADELKLAAEEKVELATTPIALDAFIFVLNGANPVSGLTVEQIQGIYTGKITDWGSLGGKPGKITPVRREDTSGSEPLMKELVMKSLPMIEVKPMLRALTMSRAFTALEADQRAISYSLHYYQQYLAPDVNVKLCAVNGIMPSSETIRNRTYPFVSEVYVVTRKDLPQDSPAAKLRDWLLTDEGQRVVAKSGYVPINPNIR